MINITLKVDDEEVDNVRWMKDVWEDTWLIKPNNMEVQIGTLCETEKEYLNKVMQWVYPFHDDDSTVVVNDKEYKVNSIRVKQPDNTYVGQSSDDLVDTMRWWGVDLGSSPDNTTHTHVEL